ncbi:MAG: hypothetical protein ABIJ86_11765, partial [Spirochaetota bacterium]
ANPEKMHTLIGQLVEFREILTRRGKNMAFGKVEGYGGCMDIVLFSDTLERNPGRFVADAIVFLRGKIDTGRENPSFKVEEFVNPADLREKSYRDVHIELHPVRREDDLESLRDILYASSGQCGVVLHVKGPQGQVAVRAHAQINCAPKTEVVEKIRDTPVVADVWLD